MFQTTSPDGSLGSPGGIWASSGSPAAQMKELSSSLSSRPELAIMSSIARALAEVRSDCRRASDLRRLAAGEAADAGGLIC